MKEQNLHVRVLLGIALVTGAFGCSERVHEGFATPEDAFHTYLLGVKKNDLSAAKECFWIPNKGDPTVRKSILDVCAGMPIAFRRFNSAMKALGISENELGHTFFRSNTTDQAIDRTLSRLGASNSVIKGRTAELTVAWEEEDSPNEAFMFGDEPISFHKTGKGWKINTLAVTDIDEATLKTMSGLPPGSWILGWHNAIVFLNEISSLAESGKVKTLDDVIREIEARQGGTLEGMIPHTQEVIFEEDSNERYLRIRKGNPHIGLGGPAHLPHRQDIKYPVRVEGDLEFVFESMYGSIHREETIKLSLLGKKEPPKIVVETSNKQGYEVIFDPDDQNALAVVAEQLGLLIGEELRKVDGRDIKVLVIKDK